MKPNGLSPSSYNTFEGCQHKYYIENFLGIRYPAGRSAYLGSIFHAICESFALIKLAAQNGNKTITMDELGGEKDISTIDVNNVREYEIESLANEIYDHYAKIVTDNIKLAKGDKGKIIQWIYDLLQFKDGEFNPFKMEIIHPEKPFSIPIQKDWAIIDEEKRFCVRGVIDLVYKTPDGIGILDYKTGATRKDFNTGKMKEYEDFYDDIQLLLYNWAATAEFPEYEHREITIYYIQAGGPYTCYFSDIDIARAEQRIERRFKEIAAITIPRLNKSWRCKQFCPFYKEKFENPMIEFRNGKFTEIGQPMSICQEVEFSIRQYGMEFTVEKYKKKKE